MINTKEKLADRGALVAYPALRSVQVLFSLPDERLRDRLADRIQEDSEPVGTAGSLERRMNVGGQLQPDTKKIEKGIQGTVENIKLHQKGKTVVTMEEQEEPEGCASCGQKGVKTFQYQMCRSCLAKKLRGIQDFIDEQRKEIFGDR